jgi:hypothetical protein
VCICNECVEQCLELLEDEGVLSRSIQKVDLAMLGIKPRFSKVQFIVKENHCFYLCPFQEPFNIIYRDHIVPAFESVGFSIERADQIFGVEPIIDDIWEAINTSTIVAADVTGRNPNVMYEIGMAHTIGKPVIIITQSMDDVPFDLKHYRCIVYSYTPRGCKELQEKLEATIRFLKVKKESGG